MSSWCCTVYPFISWVRDQCCFPFTPVLCFAAASIWSRRKKQSNRLTFSGQNSQSFLYCGKTGSEYLFAFKYLRDGVESLGVRCVALGLGQQLPSLSSTAKCRMSKLVVLEILQHEPSQSTVRSLAKYVLCSFCTVTCLLSLFDSFLSI